MGMKATCQISGGRLYVHWSIHLTESFPIRAGYDGKGYVVCDDQNGAEYLRNIIAPDAELHLFGTGDFTALAIKDIPAAGIFAWHPSSTETAPRAQS
jgi:hypothetical protein